jgi:large subunit ribosomal protein L3
MGSLSAPRKGSLQYWPRKRAAKFLPSVNWTPLSDSTNSVKFQAFIGYKVGMMSAFVKDNTPHSLTKDKRIILPVTIISCPHMKIFSVRFYKNGKVAKDVLAEKLDKELKKIVKLPKKSQHNIDHVKEYDDVRVVVYSSAKETGIKKSPDIAEVALSGKADDKIKFIKENLGKDISINMLFEKGKLIDIRGVTKGHGLTGPVKRYGLKLKQHKSEKGVRRPGSLGPWNPSRVTFRAPMAGQHGLHTRAIYNSNILDIGSKENAKEILKGMKHYGDVNTDYILLTGSVMGPVKRQILLTTPLRITKKQNKKNYELVELR